MEFRFTEQQERFRKEVQDFLKAELPPGWSEGGLDLDEDLDGDGEHDAKDAFAQALAQKMATRGWITARWPIEYGGLGWTPLEQVIFSEEMTRHKVPRTYITDAGVSNVGPTIAVHGTDEQKASWLPGIAGAKERWCQLFSEPNAGSDLAGLQTTARDDGDVFVVNGTKIWSSGAHKAKWGALLCRTDPDAPKHRGISYLIVDMTSPGITFAPIINICDVYSFNQVFLDDVRVPKSNLIGEQNRGWYSATTTLNLERSFIRHALISQLYFDEVLTVLRDGADGHNILDRNPALRHKLADIAVDLRVARLLAYRVAWLQSQGDPPSYESSVSKLYCGEMAQRLAQIVMETFGQYGQVKKDSKHAVLRGKAQQIYLTQRGITIGGGTSEIQRSLIARRGLGLGG
ncbi:MAG: acyl-CoA dehydrogenase family protein [Chloroflexi bacterium]|nr:acyl-CoA dehydrogenase family protein [Chloroflexota bacterium]